MDDAGGETIVAVASPPGPADRGILRVSGARARALVGATCRGQDARPIVPERRGLYFGRFSDGRGEQPLMLLWMPGPHSFTREDVAELHLPGAPPLIAAALERLLSLGARSAEPGEFTRRAFLNGRIDLTRAEGVLALVAARTRAERRAASRLLLGGLDERMRALREGLDGLRALCEASLDFDESDTGHVAAEQLIADGLAVQRGLDEALAWEAARQPSSDRPRVVLAGAPNAGKSRLFNLLVAEHLPGDEAIVSDLSGTTRDVKTALWSVGGVDALLSDTAGVEAATPGPGATAQAYGERARSTADLVLWVVDASSGSVPPVPPDPGQGAAPVLVVWNQIDRPRAPQGPPASHRVAAGWAAVSAATGAGVWALERLVGCLFEGDRAGSASLGRELSARHRQALGAARAELAHGLEGMRSGWPLDLFAEALRAATAQLDGITGRTTPEDLLDRIFARFCLGK